MYKLEKLNVVKIVPTEHEREKLLAKGFKDAEKEEKKEEKKKDEKKAAK
ncbi:hypothetical protein [Acetivibrio thermocellus]|nr:hypothetical protein [Acetivibrio thermocellus]